MLVAATAEAHGLNGLVLATMMSGGFLLAAGYLGTRFFISGTSASVRRMSFAHGFHRLTSNMRLRLATRVMSSESVAALWADSAA